MDMRRAYFDTKMARPRSKRDFAKLPNYIVILTIVKIQWCANRRIEHKQQ